MYTHQKPRWTYHNNHCSKDLASCIHTKTIDRKCRPSYRSLVPGIRVLKCHENVFMVYLLAALYLVLKDIVVIIPATWSNWSCGGDDTQFVCLAL